MAHELSKIGLGGGCHWCTEGVFNSLVGVSKVKQGWIASIGEDANYSEAVEVYFDPTEISLSDLIEIHLFTHASSSSHSMRDKYRSAIYAYNDEQLVHANSIINMLQANFEKPVITQVYHFAQFRENKIALQDYFYTAPNRPFCQVYIKPKIKLLLRRFTCHVDQKKTSTINS